MKKLSYILCVMAMASCAGGNSWNPAFLESADSNGAVPFDRISNADFLPAAKEGIRQNKAEIDAIVACPDAPTFENTIEALEKSGRLLENVQGIFYNLIETDADDVLKETEKAAIPLLTDLQSYIYMNDKLFSRVKELNDKKDELGLTAEQKKVLDKYYREFVNGGALLEGADRERFTQINTRLMELQMEFADNVLDETNDYLLNVTDESRLAGLPADQMEAAAARAKEKGLEGWAFNIQKPCWIPFLQYCQDRDLREQMYKAYYTRGNNNNKFDNKAIIKEILQLRLEFANLLGYKTFADFKLEDRMAKTPQAAYDLLMTIWNAALPQAKRELAELQQIADAEGKGVKVEAWDWWYYSEKLRAAKYNLDEAQLMPYFTLDNARKGSMAVAEHLFGIKFRKVEGLPVYNPTVETWECLDSDGSHLAYFYTDCFVRATKRQGAWMNNFTPAYDFGGESARPCIVNVLNFSNPTESTPCLLSIDDARTVFHEFGHALHGMLTKCHYPMVSGTATPNDFVELPSQIMEHWAVDPEIMKTYAFHYKTGEVIPDELIAKMQNAGHFNTGFETVELVGAALLDMEYHMLSDYSDFDDQKFEDAISAKLGMIPQIEYRYRGTFFNHVFNNDYSAGYYSYLWAEVLDCDAFECFREHGIMNQETGMSFRKNILEKGGSDDLMEMYRAFRGADPTPAAMLKERGLAE